MLNFLSGIFTLFSACFLKTKIRKKIEMTKYSFLYIFFAVTIFFRIFAEIM